MRPPDEPVPNRGDGGRVERRRSPLRRAARFVFRLVILGGVIAAAGLWAAQETLDTAGPLTADAVVVVPRGSGPEAIARRLGEAGVLVDNERVRLVLRAYGAIAQYLPGLCPPLKAGEYSFPKAASLRRVIEILGEGRSVDRFLTVAEGLTTAQVLELVAAAEGLEGTIGRRPGEGALLPQTYAYGFGDTRDELIARMETEMRRTLAELWAKRVGGLPLRTPAEALVLASIVEKETGVAGERRLIAAVFLNRLRAGMKLQADPTVVYAITGGRGPLGRPITRSDLAQRHPYNTYDVVGLPPGPIANPGRDSIAAVVDPASEPYLYFVADGSGGHVFAATLIDHNRNVARWREIEKQRGMAAPGQRP